uniref:Transmembrane protein 131 n=1 Tax=Plectus sambesii TaxID=2011161 RepID=A0A914XGB6_9BILA
MVNRIVICALVLLNVAVNCLTLDEHQAAFVQTGDELHYFSDSQQLHESGSLLAQTAFMKSANAVDATAQETHASLNQLKLDPAVLRFGEHAIGVPSLQKVTVRNPTASKVRFDAISGSTVHFHCSFPEHKTVEPGDETTFDVVFLPRQEGTIENTLFVHSSLGTFTYTVAGVGRANPYRLRPFVGARIPLNGSFVSSPELHNPHSTTLRVTEMYTSGGDLHLELPDGAGVGQAPSSLWEIAPYQTKTVMRAKFIAARERNTTSFIRIRTDLKRASADDSGYQARTQTIVVPVEVEVTGKKGLFATTDMIDFGLIKAGNESITLELRIVSTLDKSIDIEKLNVESDRADHGVRMEFGSKPPIAVKSAARGQPGAAVLIAKLTFDSKLLKTTRDPGAMSEPRLEKLTGRLVAESRGGNYKVSVPYLATVYYGQLLHNPEETAFHTTLEAPINRVVSVKNRFPFGIAIWNVSLPRSAREFFSAKLLTKVVTLAPGESKVVFSLKYLHRRREPFSSFCRLYTNVSKFDLPLVTFDGQLRITLYSIDQKQFDFGLMDAGDRRSIQFAITNENPVPITVKQFRHSLEAVSSLRLLGTPYEGRYYPVSFTTEEGAIVSIPDKLIFSDAFPGKMSSQALQVFSTFPRDMPLLRLTTLSHDPRIFFESFDANQPPLIKKGEMSYLGRIMFLPAASCLDDCYVGMPLHTTDGQWFTYGMRLPSNLAEIDAYLYQRLRKKWLAIEQAGKDVVNATVVVDSTEVKQFEVPAVGKLIWPRLMKQSVVHFPLTAVGNFTIVNLTLHNPSSLPVVVQLLPLTIYPDPEGVVHFFRDDVASPLTEPIEMNETLMFTLRDTELFNLKPDSPVPKFREQLEDILGIQIPRFTLSMILQPSMKVRVRVGFLPSDYTLRSSLLLIRNNLTVMEPVVLYGRGATVDLKISNRAARSTPLLFEIQDRHLADCHNPKRLTHKLMTTLTVRRSFLARNTGEVVINVVNMTISGKPCENYGFRILNCEPFRLKPNETHMLEVAFTPDFTSSWNEAAMQIYMHMNGTPWVYPIAASIPREWLSKCHAALPRPHFEQLMYYSCVSALIFCLVCVIACAYLEGDRIIVCALRQQLKQTRRVFDLNAPDDHQSEPLNQNVRPNGSPGARVRLPDDANRLAKAFSAVANKVLLPAGLVWRRLRGDATPKASTRPPKVKGPVTVSVKNNNQHKASRSAPSQMALSRKSSVDEQSGRETSGKATQKAKRVKQGRQRSPKSHHPPEPDHRTTSDPLSTYPTVTGDWEIAGVRKPTPINKSPSDKNYVSDVDSSRPKPRQRKDGARSDVEDVVKTDAALSRDSRADRSVSLNMMSKNKSSDQEVPSDPATSQATPVEERKAFAPLTPRLNTEPAMGLASENAAMMTGDGCSDDSEESAVPEWADAGPIGPINYDDDFATLANRTQSFATTVTKRPQETTPRASSNAVAGRTAARNRRQAAQGGEMSSSSRSESCSSVASSGSSSPSPLSASSPAMLPLPSARRRGREQVGKGTTMSSPRRQQQQRDRKTASQTTANRWGSMPAAAAGATAAASNANGVSLMQQLQEERRQRWEEYRSNRRDGLQAEEWPGFNLPLPAVAETLWDAEFEPNQFDPENIWGTPPTLNSAWPTALDGASLSSGANSEPLRGSSPTVISPLQLDRDAVTFKLNPAAQPFVSTRQGSPNYKQTTPPPADSSIVAWGPPSGSSSPTNHMTEESNAGALSLAGSLFSAGVGSIWDPLQPVDPEVSWAEAMLAEDDQKLPPGLR